MTIKNLEIVVRDIQKTLELTLSEMRSMKSVIGEQNTKISQQGEIISSQVDIIKRLKSLVEGNSSNSTQKPSPTNIITPTALQRPLRQARLKVASALLSTTGTGYAATTNKVSATASKKPRSAINSETSAAPTTPDVSRNENSGTTYKEQSHTSVKNAARPSTAIYDNLGDSDEKQDDWHTVIRKRSGKKQQRRILTGSGEADDELQTIERRKYIQTWSFKPETTTDNIRRYINKIEKCDDYTIEKRNIKTDKHAAFTIGFPESLYVKLCNPAAWPPGVKVADWWFPRQPRGCGASTQPVHASASHSDAAQRAHI